MEKRHKDWFQYGLAAVFVVGFFVVMKSLLNHEVPVGNKDAVNILFGILGGALGSIVGYFYGSSKGSAEKNDLISKKDQP